MCPVGTTARSIGWKTAIILITVGIMPIPGSILLRSAVISYGVGFSRLLQNTAPRGPQKSCKIPYRGDKEKIMFSQGWAPGFLKLQGVKNENKIK